MRDIAMYLKYTKSNPRPEIYAVMKFTSNEHTSSEIFQL